MKQIITSILDNDLYKFTQQYAVIKKFPNLKVKYAFKDRNNQIYPKGFDFFLKLQIRMMQDIKLNADETQFLRKLKLFPEYYIDFLKGYRFNPDEVEVIQDEEGHLHIIIEGFWYRAILWEVVILAIVSELFYEETHCSPIINEEKNYAKLIKMYRYNAYFAEFGTRRRYSKEVQDNIISLFVDTKITEVIRYNQIFVGASNVHFAHKYDIKPIGTMAHEWIMAHGAIFGYKMANYLALEHWIDVYNGDLGIALSDTYTTDVFLQSFDIKHSKLFDGVRQDSGDPFEFTDKMINHYKSLGINPMSKIIIFSNALDVDLACDIKEYCAGKIKCSFGIGTNLTNDVGVKPMNIVIKLSHVLFNEGWVETVKLSDDLGKNTGNIKEIELCKKILNNEFTGTLMNK